MVATLQASDASPFLLNPDGVEILAQSDGFKVLREHLAEHCTYALCDGHASSHLDDLSQWLLVRDAFYALLVPIVELYDKAATLAALATAATKAEHLEHAFNGQARSAFTWLHCFLSNEQKRDWCYTRGCPTCIIAGALSSECTITLVYTACLLSDVHYPFTLEGPTLPSFMFFLEPLERALTRNPSYGSGFFEQTQQKAISTRNGIEELIHQCVDLDGLAGQTVQQSAP